MRYFYKLLNYEVKKHIFFVISIFIGTLVTPITFIRLSLENYHNVFENYETIYQLSGCVIVFLLFFSAVTSVCIYSFYSNYTSSKSIYTYLSLPIRRETFYFSKLFSFVIYYLVFLSGQLIGIFAGYQVFISHLSSSAYNSINIMNNGLFLAFVRLGFFRLIIPLGMESAISSLSIFLSFLTGLYFALICERSKRYFAISAVIPAIYLNISVISYRFSMTSEYKNLYINSFILLLLSSFYVFYSVRLMKKSAVS